MSRACMQWNPPHVVPLWPPESLDRQMPHEHQSKSLQDFLMHYDGYVSILSGFVIVLVSMATLQFNERWRRHCDATRNGEIDGLPLECRKCGNSNRAILRACICRKVVYCSKTCQAQHYWKDGHKNNCITIIQPESLLSVAATSTQAGSIENPPPHLCCPITSDLFEDPVVAADGETYERNAIERWINDKKKEIRNAQEYIRRHGRNTALQEKIQTGVLSPMGFGRLNNNQLFPNRVLYRLSEEWANACRKAQAAKHTVEPMIDLVGPSLPNT